TERSAPLRSDTERRRRPPRFMIVRLPDLDCNWCKVAGALPRSRLATMRIRWLFVAFAALVAFSVTTTVPRSARADARTEARAHFKKGMDAIGQGRYEDGIAELQCAYEILPYPNVLYNIARAY